MDCRDELATLTSPMVYADIGGSLVKVALLTPILQDEVPQKAPLPPHKVHKVCSNRNFEDNFCPHLTIECPSLGGTLFFYTFPVIHNLELFLSFLSAVYPADTLKGSCLHFTGGGALKYAELLKMATGANQVQYHDELQTIVGGLRLLSKLGLKEELQELTPSGLKPFSGVLNHFLLVQVGSGTSIVEVAANKATRIDGSALGGATFMGLSSCICGSNHGFKDLLEAAKRGNANSADLLVGDICDSTTYLDILGSDVLAACGGKMRTNSDDIDSTIASILRMLVINIVHISALNAKMTNATTILLSGGFMDSVGVTAGYYAEALSWYGHKNLKGLVVRHHAFLGVLGILTTLKGWFNADLRF